MPAAWKAPYRTKHEISQTFNDGIVTIYAVDDTAAPGYQPVRALTEKVTLRFARRRLGVQRFYEAKQAQSEIEHVIRVPRPPCPIRAQDVAVLSGDGAQYRIEQTQEAVGTHPPCVDLTLARISQALPFADKEASGDVV